MVIYELIGGLVFLGVLYLGILWLEEHVRITNTTSEHETDNNKSGGK